jgi:hypothetical protein
VPKYPKGQKISLLAAMTNSDLLGFILFEGRVKIQDFGCFDIEIIKNNPKIKANIAKIAWCFDNAVIHTDFILGNLLLKIRIFYSPPHAPFLSPLENVFGL